MTFAQGAIGGILHDEKGDAIFYVKIKATHDMGMHETSEHACLGTESLSVFTREVGMQYFDSCLCVEVQVFSQVDLGNATSPDETKQAIVANLLSYTVSHTRLLTLWFQGSHGRDKPWSRDKSGTYYHETPWQADAFVSW